MNTNNDPNLNDMNYYNTCDILQMDGFGDPELHNGLGLSGFDLPRRISFSNDDFCENYDDPSQSLNCFQCDKLFDNEPTINGNWITLNEENDIEIRNIASSPDKKNEEVSAQAPFKIWKCKYNCGKIFTQEKYMNTHILVMHENVKTLLCKICSMYLSTESRLKNHMLRHSKVKHLVCLLCMNKRTKELSCMRHHLLKKHNIGMKHPLFSETYYQMSLKEIAFEENNKKEETSKKSMKQSEKKTSFLSNTLKEKLFEKSKIIKGKCEVLSLNKDQVKENKTSSFVSNMSVVSLEQQGTNDIDESCAKKTQRIVIAENGMKLVKMPNGQFRKVKW